ncbi:MAG: glycoside hydrolase family 3 protein [Nitrospinota bacterium]|nr:glycoside hydrolase family 3 protein [Nitrospinota bacterium]
MDLKNWTTDEKAGQHFIIGFEGVSAPKFLTERIENGQIGGIILLKRNIENLRQLSDLINDLQKAALNSRLKVPLFISIDEEGGRVSRLSSDFIDLPSAQLLAKNKETKIIKELVCKLAKQMKKVGINLNFSPVLDLSTNPKCLVIGDRSLGTKPENVGRLGSEIIGYFQSNMIAACAKHFPGIGEIQVDPHYQLPICEISEETLRTRELIPFKFAIDSENDYEQVLTVMVGHTIYTKIDPDYISSQSKKIITTILREQLSFQGLVLTDDLDMGAISLSANNAFKSINAGADIALICNNFENYKRNFNFLCEKIEKCKLNPELEMESLKRILKIKQIVI